jgi:PIN domain-containing protein
MYTSFGSLSQSEMDVILDANIYTALLLSQGRKIFLSNAFVELFTYLRRTKSNLIVPGPVFHEVIKEYSELISGSIKKAQDSWTTLQRDTISKLTDCFPPKRDAEVKAFQEKFLNLGLGFEVVVLEDYKNIALGEVVRRGVHRIRPANDKGEELRDVVIWLMALEHAKARNSCVTFITDDGHFKGPDEALHPDLLQDLATHKVELQYYDSIPKFVRGNALERSVVTADEIARMVGKDVITGLVTERFDLVYEDIMVSDTQFQGAEKYKVGDDSFYVEAKYITVVRYSSITRPLNSVWLQTIPTQFTVNAVQPPVQINSPYASGIQNTLFSRIGEQMALTAATPMTITTDPITIRTNYEAVVNLVLSFRTESGTTQSVEILDIEISKNTQLSEVPVASELFFNS